MLEEFVLMLWYWFIRCWWLLEFLMICVKSVLYVLFGCFWMWNGFFVFCIFFFCRCLMVLLVNINFFFIDCRWFEVCVSFFVFCKSKFWILLCCCLILVIFMVCWLEIFFVLWFLVVIFFCNVLLFFFVLLSLWWVCLSFMVCLKMFV